MVLAAIGYRDKCPVRYIRCRVSTEPCVNKWTNQAIQCAIHPVRRGACTFCAQKTARGAGCATCLRCVRAGEGWCTVDGAQWKCTTVQRRVLYNACVSTVE